MQNPRANFFPGESFFSLTMENGEKFQETLYLHIL